VRSDAEVSRARATLDAAKVQYKVLDERVEISSGHVSLCTVHLAKGLEFRAVAVMDCDALRRRHPGARPSARHQRGAGVGVFGGFGIDRVRPGASESERPSRAETASRMGQAALPGSDDLHRFSRTGRRQSSRSTSLGRPLPCTFRIISRSWLKNPAVTMPRLKPPCGWGTRS